MEDFKFNGKWLSQFGGLLKGKSTFEIAKKNFELIKIAGKSGQSFIDYGNYDNVEFKREIVVADNLSPLNERKNVEAILNWLAYADGYCEFRDTLHNGFFTKAVLTNFDEIVEEFNNKIHSATLKFSRLPFWYSDIGEKEVVFTGDQIQNGIELHNPFLLNSTPNIEIEWLENSGQPRKTAIEINGVSSSINRPDNVVSATLDFENLTSTVSVASEITPVYFNFSAFDGLAFGKNTIKISETNSKIASVKIKPRWRKL